MGLAHRDIETVIETSPQLIESLHAAREFATRSGLVEVLPNHLLLAMLADDEASFLLDAYGIDFDKLRLAIMKQVEKQAHKHDPDEPTVFSRAIEIVMEHARLQARRNGVAEVDSNLVLAVLLTDEKGEAARLLQPYDLDTSGVLQYLELRVGKSIQVDPLPPLPAPAKARPRQMKKAETPVSTVPATVQPQPPASAAQAQPLPAPAPFAQSLPPLYAHLRVQGAAPAPGSPMTGAMPLRASVSPAFPINAFAQPAGAPAQARPLPQAAGGSAAPQQTAPSARPVAAPPTSLVDQIIARSNSADMSGGVDARSGQQPAGAPRPVRRRPAQEKQRVSGGLSATGSVLEKGRLVENVPRRMKAERACEAEVRITRAQMNEIADEFAGSSAGHLHELALTEAMTVQLRAPGGGFHIENLSPQTQWIDRNQRHVDDADFGVWRWNVTPRKAGRARLQLVVSARTVDDAGTIHIADVPDKIIDVCVVRDRVRFTKRLAVLVLVGLGGLLVGRYAGEAAALLASLPAMLR